MPHYGVYDKSIDCPFKAETRRLMTAFLLEKVESTPHVLSLAGPRPSRFLDEVKRINAKGYVYFVERDYKTYRRAAANLCRLYFPDKDYNIVHTELDLLDTEKTFNAFDLDFCGQASKRNMLTAFRTVMKTRNNEFVRANIGVGVDRSKVEKADLTNYHGVRKDVLGVAMPRAHAIVRYFNHFEHKFNLNSAFQWDVARAITYVNSNTNARYVQVGLRRNLVSISRSPKSWVEQIYQNLQFLQRIK